jgi:hypothetical protein
MACRFYEFTVEGKDCFPIDMLRYDSCWPMTSDDVFMMPIEHNAPERRRVTLASHKEPTGARWESFGWTIIDRKPSRRM